MWRFLLVSTRQTAPFTLETWADCKSTRRKASLNLKNIQISSPLKGEWSLLYLWFLHVSSICYRCSVFRNAEMVLNCTDCSQRHNIGWGRPKLRLILMHFLSSIFILSAHLSSFCRKNPACVELICVRRLLREKSNTFRLSVGGVVLWY